MAPKLGKMSISKIKARSKTSLNSPYVKIWTPVVGEDMQFILKTLLKMLEEFGLKKIETHPTAGKGRKKRKKPQDSEGNNNNSDKDDKGSDTETPKKAVPETGWTNKDLRKQLAVGINEVTRALEKNDLFLVIVCKSAKPEMITKHIMELSYSREVPALQLPRLSENIAPTLGLKSVLALGLRKSADLFHEQVKAILPLVPPLHVPWLPIEGATPKKFIVSVEEDEPEEAEPGNPPSAKKRKLSTAVPVDIKLHNLKVKKIVPNPAKKKKKKEKKAQKKVLKQKTK
ncbi:hypothetical protein GDO81_012553 [Engystomops pustulosus]|uniref:Ribosomal protein eL8/eL30/eS12/Gadd45 domain-containing protein n=1 Tax=Engystomops pustulosus TaxID=76066 RepID=A0AAV7BMA5_ENGPU|nr:hypothetical protein GDO81_012553 [Engystomops pustulosus]